MNWIQKHALGVLIRVDQASLKQMKPEGVDSNLFSYHIHYLKSQLIIESVSRGYYRLTSTGMRIAGKFNSVTIQEADNVKTIIVLYARRDDEVLLFTWSRHPYFGYSTLPHDRYNYGQSLIDALAEAVQDKLALTIQEANPTYRKSGILHIFHDDEEISCMSAHVYAVDARCVTDGLTTRNGTLQWLPINELANTATVMRGLDEFVTTIVRSDVGLFDVSLRY